MDTNRLLLVFAAILLLCGLAFGVISILHRLRQRKLARAQHLFKLRREWLEAEFQSCASRSGKPRGLRWIDCDFSNEVTFARDRSNGQLRALVGMTVGFEAVEGGDMEDVEAVSNLRFATAVFHFTRDKWETDGRAIFNLDPFETIRHFRHELERVS